MYKKTFFATVLFSFYLLSTQLYAAVNVLNFGAIGDGTMNDTKAFKKALAAGNKSIHIPPGTYKIGPETLVVPAGVQITGGGNATRLVPADGTVTLLRLSKNCSLRNFCIKGGKVKKGSTGAPGLVHIEKVDNVSIDNVKFTNIDRVCIRTHYANDINIRNCDFRNIGMSMNIRYTNRAKVLNNTIIDARLHGIEAWGSKGSGKGREHEKILGEDLIFANNYIKNTGITGIMTAGCRRVVIANNIVDTVKDVGLDPEFSEDVVISGNTTRNCYNAGISLFFTCKRVSITGNTVYNNSVPKDKEKSAIFTMLQRKLSKEEIKLPWYVRSGIWLVPPNREKMATDTGHEDVSIVGNTIYTVGDDGIPRRDIWIGAEVKNVRIEANTLSGKGIYYGGHHMVHPQTLKKLGKQPLIIDNMPTPDKAKF